MMALTVSFTLAVLAVFDVLVFTATVASIIQALFDVSGFVTHLRKESENC